MARVTVDAGALTRAGQGLRRVGEEYGASAAGLSAAFGAVAAAAGDAAVHMAALEASERWGSSIARGGSALAALGENLARAAEAYESVEADTSGRLAAAAATPAS